MTQTNLRIPFQAEGFPAGIFARPYSDLLVSWDDILWAAVTVGRPNRNYVFRHGDASAMKQYFAGHWSEWHWSRAVFARIAYKEPTL
jgi:hypothetical protein